MLVLSRQVGEEVVIADNIRVTILAAKGGRVRIGIAAPPSVRVDRQEVHDRRGEFRPTRPAREWEGIKI